MQDQSTDMNSYTSKFHFERCHHVHSLIRCNCLQNIQNTKTDNIISENNIILVETSDLKDNKLTSMNCNVYLQVFILYQCQDGIRGAEII